jgi:hypothetical protein
MRNDARPIGGDTSHQSPVAGHGLPEVRQPRDVVNRESGIYRPRPESAVEDREPVLDFDADPVMPANDETLNTKI